MSYSERGVPFIFRLIVDDISKTRIGGIGRV